MSDETLRLRLTVTVEYDADPNDYGTTDPVEAAKIDEENWRNDPMMIFSTFEDDQYKVSVEPL